MEIPVALERYVENHTTPESPLLQHINRETHAKIMKPRMLSGHIQGRMLAMISQMIRPQRVLELGTYTGYSAICLAEGMPAGGKLITLDINEELEDMTRKHFAQAGLTDKIDYRIGDALQLIPTLEDTFDLVFIDADKENNSNYYDLVIDKVNLNGWILADNVLWSGKVLGDKLDKDTRAVLDFNRKIQEDTRVENVLLPVRDGIMMIRKVSL